MPGSSVLHYLPEFAQIHVHLPIESVMLSNYLFLYCPLLFPSIFPSIRVFSKESALHSDAKELDLQISNSPPNEYSGLISFRSEW